MKATIAIALVLVLLAGGAYWYMHKAATAKSIAKISSFEECGALYPVMESYPPRCATPDGRSFTQDVGNELSKMDLITIDAPRPTAKISSPLTVTGKARGTWYFEASFPVELQDAQGNVIVQTHAEAQSDWMTEDFVPYKLTLTFPTQPAGSHGKLILRKDNPSGDPAKDDSLVVPVVF